MCNNDLLLHLKPGGLLTSVLTISVLWLLSDTYYWMLNILRCEVMFELIKERIISLMEDGSE